MLCLNCFNYQLSQISDPVERAKVIFTLKRRGNSKILKLNFDRLHQLFKIGCNTFDSIGEKCGATRQGVEIVFKRYFAKIIPDKLTGRIRRKICKKKKRIILRNKLFERASNNLNSPTNSSYLSPLLKELRKRCFDVEPVLRRRETQVDPTCLLINSCKCKLSILTINSNQIYARLAMRSGVVNKIDFKIVIIKDGDEMKFLIIPSDVVLSYSNRKQFTVYINPRLKTHHDGRPPRVDWNKYENAWYLLEKSGTMNVGSA